MALRPGRFAAALLGLVACAAVQADASANEPGRCDLDYRVRALGAAQPAELEVELHFAAEGRRESWLRIQRGWAGVQDYPESFGAWEALGRGQSVQPGPDAARVRVLHGPDETVRLRWRVRSALADPEAVAPQDQLLMYRSQIGARGYQFFGYGVLPSVEAWGDERLARLCLTLQPFDAQSPAFGTPGKSAPGQDLHWKFSGSHARLRHAFYASGPMWRLLERPVQGGALELALRGSFAKLDDAAFADGAARLIDLQRRFWDGAATTPASAARSERQWLVLTPNHLPDGNSGGTLVDRAAVLHVPQDFSAGSATFEFLVAHENLHRWFPARFGAHGGEDAQQAARHYWFSEGFTDHYSYRLLLASGLWDLERYASQLTQRLRVSYLGSRARNLSAEEIAPRFFSDREAGRQMYIRGELLALRWDAALRRGGRGSLTQLLQGLLLPADGAAEAKPQVAAPRVLDALATALAGSGVDPRAELQRYVVEGQTLPLLSAGWAEALGPCLQRDEEAVHRWQLGFDRESFKTRVLQGVEPDGPAFAAGLRDGMALAGFSVYGGDLTRDALIQVKEEAAAEGGKPAVRSVSYRPVSREAQLQPRWRPRTGALDDAACRAWISAR